MDYRLFSARERFCSLDTGHFINGVVPVAPVYLALPTFDQGTMLQDQTGWASPFSGNWHPFLGAILIRYFGGVDLPLPIFGHGEFKLG